jgi:hypothetical protein
VPVPDERARLGAEVLVAAQAVAAGEAGRPLPPHAHPVARGEARHVRPDLPDDPHHLVARDERVAGLPPIVVDHVQVAAAHAAGVDLDEAAGGSEVGRLVAERLERRAPGGRGEGFDSHRPSLTGAGAARASILIARA